jgi:hypothetical protein
MPILVYHPSLRREEPISKHPTRHETLVGEKKGLTFFLKSLRNYKAFAAHFLSQLFPGATAAAAAVPVCESLLQT